MPGPYDSRGKKVNEVKTYDVFGSHIPDDATGDVFGQIYEYFLGRFALSEGQGGGEFFTPRSVVRLMVEIIEPHGGTVFDPACGSGGMFVQSADFIDEHRKELEAQGKDTSVFVYGQEKQGETVKLARMNIAVNGLRGEIKQGSANNPPRMAPTKVCQWSMRLMIVSILNYVLTPNHNADNTVTVELHKN